MNKLILVILATSFLFTASGCVTQKAQYVFNLEDVQRPKEVLSQYGAGSLEHLTFEDNLCKIIFSPEERGIAFDLINKSNRTIKILWDEVAYVDQYKSSHRVLHLGTKFIHSDRPQPISAVPVDAKLDDLIVPADYAEWTTTTSIWFGTKTSGWQIRPLFPKAFGFFATGSLSQFKAFVSSLDNKSIAISLPMKVGDDTNEYLFVFRVRAWIE